MHNLDELTPARRQLYRTYAELECADEISRPPNGEDGKGLIARISLPGRVHEISPEAYRFFLTTLCPRLNNGNEFCVAHDRDPLRLFWIRDDKCYCRQLTWPETRRLCQAAGLPYDGPDA